MERVLFRSLFKFNDNWVVWIDLHSFLGNHIRSHRSISESLSFHDSFHVGRPTVFTSNKYTWRISNSLSNLHLFNFISKDLFDKLTKRFKACFLFFKFLFFIFCVIKFKTLFGAIFKFFTVIFFELLDDVFINGVDHIDDFIALFLKLFNERRVGYLLFRFTSNEEDVFLTFFHSSNVVFKRDLVITRGGCKVSQEISNFTSICSIFMHTEFKVFSKLFIEFFVVFGIFRNLSEEFKTFFSDVFLDNFKDFMLLKEFSRDVKRKIFRVNNTFNETEIVRDKFLAVIHNEDSSNVEFDVVFLLFGFEEIKWSSFGDVENGSEF